MSPHSSASGARKSRPNWAADATHARRSRANPGCAQALRPSAALPARPSAAAERQPPRQPAQQPASRAALQSVSRPASMRRRAPPGDGSPKPDDPRRKARVVLRHAHPVQRLEHALMAGDAIDFGDISQHSQPVLGERRCQRHHVIVVQVAHHADAVPRGHAPRRALIPHFQRPRSVAIVAVHAERLRHRDHEGVGPLRLLDRAEVAAAQCLSRLYANVFASQQIRRKGIVRAVRSVRPLSDGLFLPALPAIRPLSADCPGSMYQRYSGTGLPR